VHTGEQLQFLMLSLYLLHVYRLGIPLARLRNYLPLRGYHHSGNEKKIQMEIRMAKLLLCEKSKCFASLSSYTVRTDSRKDRLSQQHTERSDTHWPMQDCRSSSLLW